MLKDLVDNFVSRFRRTPDYVTKPGDAVYDIDAYYARRRDLLTRRPTAATPFAEEPLPDVDRRIEDALHGRPVAQYVQVVTPEASEIVDLREGSWADRCENLGSVMEGVLWPRAYRLTVGEMIADLRGMDPASPATQQLRVIVNNLTHSALTGSISDAELDEAVQQATALRAAAQAD